jgi:hypothetical protein
VVGCLVADSILPQFSEELLLIMQEECRIYAAFRVSQLTIRGYIGNCETLLKLIDNS